MATEQMKHRAAEFEREQNKAEKSMLAHRARRVKKEGYKSESDYFANTNPFKNTDPKRSFTKSISKALKAKKK